jgi:hypothetical protein
MNKSKALPISVFVHARKRYCHVAGTRIRVIECHLDAAVNAMLGENNLEPAHLSVTSSTPSALHKVTVRSLRWRVSVSISPLHRADIRYRRRWYRAFGASSLPRWTCEWWAISPSGNDSGWGVKKQLTQLTSRDINKHGHMRSSVSSISNLVLGQGRGGHEAVSSRQISSHL